MGQLSFTEPSEIKVGVVGYGGAYNMGRQHLSEMAAAGMVPTAVAELDPARLAIAEKDFPGIATYPGLDALLEKSGVDLLTIITPHNTHAPLGLQVLKSGCHCVLEKPMALTTAECNDLIDTAKSSGRMVSTYHNRHWDGWILQALDLQRSGELGKIIKIEARMGRYQAPGPTWRSSRRLSGGILYDWGVHLLEYSLQLITDPITEVSGYAWEGYWASQPDAPFAGEANEDDALAVVRFAGGQRVCLCITSLDASPDPGMLKIVGTKATHIIDFGDSETVSSPVAREWVRHRKPNRPGEGHRFYENVAAYLCGKEELVITGEWARRPIHILDLAARSAREGRALPAEFA